MIVKDDGEFCDYEESDKLTKVPKNCFLKKLYSIEMYKKVYEKLHKPKCLVSFYSENKKRKIELEDEITVEEKFKHERINSVLTSDNRKGLLR